jgi:hypothetical protein
MMGETTKSKADRMRYLQVQAEKVEMAKDQIGKLKQALANPPFTIPPDWVAWIQ